MVTLQRKHSELYEKYKNSTKNNSEKKLNNTLNALNNYLKKQNKNKNKYENYNENSKIKGAIKFLNKLNPLAAILDKQFDLTDKTFEFFQKNNKNNSNKFNKKIKFSNIIKEKNSNLNDDISAIRNTLDAIAHDLNVTQKLNKKYKVIDVINPKNKNTKSFIDSLSRSIVTALSKSSNTKIIQMALLGIGVGSALVPFGERKKSVLQRINEFNPLSPDSKWNPANEEFGRRDKSKRTPITSRFGKRKDPLTGKDSFHYGQDFAINEWKGKNGEQKGGQVVAPVNGIIDEVDNVGKTTHGKFIVLNVMNSGNYIRFSHLSKIYVKKGDQVSKGDIIGVQGSTGKSTGKHLDIKVYEKDKLGKPKNYKDPYNYGYTKNYDEMLYDYNTPKGEEYYDKTPYARFKLRYKNNKTSMNFTSKNVVAMQDSINKSKLEQKNKQQQNNKTNDAIANGKMQKLPNIAVAPPTTINFDTRDNIIHHYSQSNQPWVV